MKQSFIGKLSGGARWWEDTSPVSRHHWSSAAILSQVKLELKCREGLFMLCDVSVVVGPEHDLKRLPWRLFLRALLVSVNESGSKDTSVFRRALHRSWVMASCAAQAGDGMAPREEGACLQGSGSSRLSSMVAVALYMNAMDVSTDYSEQETWSTSFELAAADTRFWDVAGSSSSAGVGGGGLQGASSAPDEQAAAHTVC